MSTALACSSIDNLTMFNVSGFVTQLGIDSVFGVSLRYEMTGK